MLGAADATADRATLAGRDAVVATEAAERSSAAFGRAAGVDGASAARPVTRRMSPRRPPGEGVGTAEGADPVAGTACAGAAAGPEDATVVGTATGWGSAAGCRAMTGRAVDAAGVDGGAGAWVAIPALGVAEAATGGAGSAAGERAIVGRDAGRSAAVGPDSARVSEGADELGLAAGAVDGDG